MLTGIVTRPIGLIVCVGQTVWRLSKKLDVFICLTLGLEQKKHDKQDFFTGRHTFTQLLERFCGPS